MKQLDPKRLARISKTFRYMAAILDESQSAWDELVLAAREAANATKRNDWRLRNQRLRREKR